MLLHRCQRRPRQVVSLLSKFQLGIMIDHHKVRNIITTSKFKKNGCLSRNTTLVGAGWCISPFHSFRQWYDGRFKYINNNNNKVTKCFVNNRIFASNYSTNKTGKGKEALAESKKAQEELLKQGLDEGKLTADDIIDYYDNVKEKEEMGEEQTMNTMMLEEVNATLIPQTLVKPEVTDEYDVVVKVAACSVCHRDILDGKGAFPGMKTPIIPGHEISGVVVAKGDKVTNLNVGQQVVSLHWSPCMRCKACRKGQTTLCENGIKTTFLGVSTNGGYAEYVKNKCMGFVPVPPHQFTALEAAPIMCTFGTVWRAVVKKGRLKAGEHILVVGASGGVGSAMIQVAKAMNCYVTAVTSNDAKEPYLIELGADQVICTGGEMKDFHKHESIRRSKPDVVLEAVGEPTFRSSVKSLSAGGRLALIGNVTLSSVELRLGYIIVNGLEIIGSDSCTKEDLEEVMEFMITHNIKPQIAQVVPLEEALEAQRLLLEKSVCGRIILDIDSNAWHMDVEDM